MNSTGLGYVRVLLLWVAVLAGLYLLQEVFS